MDPHPVSSSLRLAAVLAAATTLLSGCASDAANARKREAEPRTKRESELQASWRGRPYHALVESFGSPRMVMDVPGHRAVKTSIAVYGVHDESVYCIDAFSIIVLDEKLLVADYFCR